MSDACSQRSPWPTQRCFTAVEAGHGARRGSSIRREHEELAWQHDGGCGHGCIRWRRTGEAVALAERGFDVALGRAGPGRAGRRRPGRGGSRGTGAAGGHGCGGLGGGRRRRRSRRRARGDRRLGQQRHDDGLRAVDTDPADIKRATEVTYLGQVHRTMAALRRMRPRDRGRIVDVGSALAYVGIPLQAAYCGAKFACREFFESVRAELIEADSNVTISMVHLPAVNTPQFSWCKAALPRPPAAGPADLPAGGGGRTDRGGGLRHPAQHRPRAGTGSSSAARRSPRRCSPLRRPHRRRRAADRRTGRPGPTVQPPLTRGRPRRAWTARRVRRPRQRRPGPGLRRLPPPASRVTRQGARRHHRLQGRCCRPPRRPRGQDQRRLDPGPARPGG